MQTIIGRLSSGPGEVGSLADAQGGRHGRMGMHYYGDDDDDGFGEYADTQPGTLSILVRQALTGSIVVVLFQLASTFWMAWLGEREMVPFRVYNSAVSSYTACVAQADPSARCRVPQPSNGVLAIGMSIFLILLLSLLISLVTLLWVAARSAYVSGKIRNGVLAAVLCSAIYTSVGILIALAVSAIGGPDFMNALSGSAQLSGGPQSALTCPALVNFNVLVKALGLLAVAAAVLAVLVSSGVIGALGGLLGKQLARARAPMVAQAHDDDDEYAYAYAPANRPVQSVNQQWTWNPSGHRPSPRPTPSAPRQPTHFTTAPRYLAPDDEWGRLPAEEPLPPSRPILPRYGDPRQDEWGRR